MKFLVTLMRFLAIYTPTFLNRFFVNLCIHLANYFGNGGKGLKLQKSKYGKTLENIVEENGVIEEEIRILYCHGGAFYLGSCNFGLRLHQILFKHILTVLPRAKITSMLVEYPLSPEKRYPAALDYALEAYRHLIQIKPATAEAKNIKYIILGDSAGSTLSLAVLFSIAKQSPNATGLPLPINITLLSPWLDLALDKVYPKKVDDILSSGFLNRGAKYYVGKNTNLVTDPTVSPIRATKDLLTSSFAQTQLVLTTSGCDLFKPDVYEFAGRVPGSIVDYEEGMIHDYQILPDLFGKTAVESIKRLGDHMVASVNPSLRADIVKSIRVDP